MNRWLLLLTLTALAWAADEAAWIGLTVEITDDEGNVTERQYYGRMTREDIAILREGRPNDGFVRLSGTCWRDEDQRLVAYGHETLDETDEVLFRASKIARLVMLRGDPHARPAPAAPAHPVPAAPAPEGQAPTF